MLPVKSFPRTAEGTNTVELADIDGTAAPVSSS